MDFLFNDLGEQTVKDNKFHAFDVVIDDSHKRTVKTNTKSKVPLFAAIVGILVLGIGSYAYYKNTIGETGQQNKQTETSDRPTILVMPFANQSGNKEQDYIGMGMTSHLITMLSQFDALLVLAKNTGEHILKNKIPNEEVVKQYGVQYVLNGTTQAAGNKVRVNVELANISKNNVIWSEVYDFNEDDIFEIQDQVGNSVLRHLGQEVIEGSATAGRRFKNPEMHKNFLLGFAAHQSGTAEGMEKAEKLWGRNLEIEPENPHAITDMGWWTLGMVQMGLSNNPQEDMQKAYRMALGVIEKHPDHVMAIQLATMVEAGMGDIDKACGRIGKMVKLAREITEIVVTAYAQRVCGDYPASIKNWERAFRISPHYSAWIRVAYVYTLLENGDLEKARDYALEQSAKDHLHTGANETFLAVLAYIASKEGDEQQAREYFVRQEGLKNSVTKSFIEFSFTSLRSRDFADDYIRVLQSLGMPD
jgi:TolB-like protein